MRRHLLLTVVALAVALPVGSAAARGRETVRTFTRTLSPGDADRLRLEFKVGELRVEGGRGSQVRVTLTLRCDRDERDCRERAEQVELRDRRRGDLLELEVKGASVILGGEPAIEALVEVPAGLAVQIDMGVGSVEVTNVGGDLDLELGVGQVEISAAQSAVRALRLAVGIGEAELSHHGGNTRVSGLIGRRLSWNNDSGGRARYEVHCGVGQVNVRLR